MTMIYIGTLLVAIALLIIAIVSAILFKKSTKALNQLGNTLDAVDLELTNLTNGVEDTLVAADTVVNDFTYKMNAVDPAFQSLAQVSNAVNIPTSVLSDQLDTYKPKEENIKKVGEAIQWSEVAVRLYRKWKVTEM